MAILTAIITHLAPSQVSRQLAYLHELSPGSRFVICHGGKRSDFDALATEDAVFIEDASLRGPAREQSYTEVVANVYEHFVRDSPEIDLVYFIEYDHLILAADFEQRLTALAAGSDAGLFAKYASPRNDTNWPHYTRARNDERLNRFIGGASRRDDRTIRWGCLGNGMLFRREALAALAELADPPHGYLELLIPTLTYHLGFDIVDVDAVSDLYGAIRWKPVFTVEEALAEKRTGRAFVHPFKDVDAIDQLLAG